MTAKSLRIKLISSRVFQCSRRYHSLRLPKFEIRRLTTADEVRDIVTARAAAWGRKPGALDHLIYFSIDKTGFFAGKLDGQTIGCVSAVKFSEDHAAVGNYVVDKPYRGSGYGRALLEAAITSLPQKCNFVFDVHEYNMPLLDDRYGYKLAWKYQRVSVVASQASAAVTKCLNSPSISVRRLSEISFNKVVEYDASIHSYSRPSYLEKWTSAPNSLTYVATSSGGSVVGYTVVRKALRQEDGWRINPLYADGSEIAMSLYRTVFHKLSFRYPSTQITIDVPSSKGNPEAFQIIQNFSARTDEYLARGYRYGLTSKYPLNKVFGM